MRTSSVYTHWHPTWLMNLTLPTFGMRRFAILGSWTVKEKNIQIFQFGSGSAVRETVYLKSVLMADELYEFIMLDKENNKVCLFYLGFLLFLTSFNKSTKMI